ncbi:MAG: regulatory signaling modulator protein AmpE [Steroidobacteraceae bacterium]|nr:regulatory signaling modulator protein AmpE [Steroidobacteraceae bacterium]
MSFLALLVALGLERLFSSRLRVRGPGWLLAYVRGALRSVLRASSGSRLAWTLGGAVLPGLAVALAIGLLGADRHGFLWTVLAAVVLFYALGPRDLQQEVDEYRAALARGDAPAAARVAAEILEHDARQRRGPVLGSVAEAVFVQANNRLFGVVFWFVLLGPFGAATFRVTDLLRREALLHAGRVDAPPVAAGVAQDCQRVHGWLAWLPARLLALSYGLAGSFEDSFAGWRRYLREESDHFADANDRLLVHAGREALGARWTAAPDEAARVGHAVGLVHVALVAWLAALAALTLVAWLA